MKRSVCRVTLFLASIWVAQVFCACSIQFYKPYSPPVSASLDPSQAPSPPRIDLYAGRYQPSGWKDGVGRSALLPVNTLGMSVIGNSVFVIDGQSIRRIDLSDPENLSVSTLAGDRNSFGTTNAPNGPGSLARFRNPKGITTDGVSLYISDTSSSCIRKIVVESGAVTTLAGLCGASGSSDGTGSVARFNAPNGITYQDSYLYVADTTNHLIRKVSLAGVVTTIVGASGAAGYTDSAIGTSARINSPTGIISDSQFLYISEPYVNATIRKVDITGVNYTTTTLAGIGTSIGGFNIGTQGNLDSANGSTSTFASPIALTQDTQFLYLVAGNASYTIRRVDKTTGATSTLGGTFGKPGSDEGVLNIGRLGPIFSIVYLSGDLYFLSEGLLRKMSTSSGVVSTVSGASSLTTPLRDTHVRLPGVSGVFPEGTDLYLFSERSNTIQKLDLSTSLITLFAGSSLIAGTTDGTLTQALFSRPWGMTKVGSDYYIVDSGNHVIRKMDIAGNITTVAGLAGTLGYANGTGSAARFKYPTDIAAVGNFLYVVDSSNSAIRQIDLSNASVTTFAGRDAPTVTTGATDGTGTNARFSSPKGIAVIGTDLYIADSSNNRIRKITSGGVVTTLAGSSSGYAEGIGTAAKFNLVSSLTTDGTYLYAVDRSNSVIRKIDPSDGSTSLLAGSPGVLGNQDGVGTNARFNFISNGLAFFNGSAMRYSSGKLYMAEPPNERVRVLDLSNQMVTTLAGGGFQTESGPALPTRPQFNSLAQVGKDLYSGYDRAIWKISSRGQAVLFAGSLTEAGLNDGSLASARFSGISHITTDGKDLYVLQGQNHSIRKIDLARGQVTTFAGASGVSGSNDASIGTNARFNGLQGACADDSYLYVPDRDNHLIRTVQLSTSEVKTIAGAVSTSGSQDGVGTDAQFNKPIACAKVGDTLYISDSLNYALRKIDLTSKTVSIYTGRIGFPGSSDGSGSQATFRNVQDLTSDGTFLYLAEGSAPDALIRRIHLQTGEVTTYAGKRNQEGIVEDTLLTDASFKQPLKVLSTAEGLFVVDSIESILWIH